VVLRKHASESLIKKTASVFRYIHFASHGQFKPDAPMQSRLLLAADNDNDGSLTVSEIYDLKLNADMVVLSACQTALGDVKNGDDVVGLNRGFLYAGAKSIVGSLWAVPDNPTKDLMIGLYTNLKSLGLREAMQKAQLSALKKYKHPFNWAAFQLTGGT
jgi:CHAT domain-containing protein